MSSQRPSVCIGATIAKTAVTISNIEEVNKITDSTINIFKEKFETYYSQIKLPTIIKQYIGHYSLDKSKEEYETYILDLNHKLTSSMLIYSQSIVNQEKYETLTKALEKKHKQNANYIRFSQANEEDLVLTEDETQILNLLEYNEDKSKVKKSRIILEKLSTPQRRINPHEVKAAISHQVATQVADLAKGEFREIGRDILEIAGVEKLARNIAASTYQLGGLLLSKFNEKYIEQKQDYKSINSTDIYSIFKDNLLPQKKEQEEKEANETVITEAQGEQDNKPKSQANHKLRKKLDSLKKKDPENNGVTLTKS